MSMGRRLLRLLGLLLLAAWLGGCATAQNPDPAEAFNRQVFAFNEGLDKYAVAPVATFYRDLTPQPLRVAVDNFFHNFQDAWSAINLLLQGRLADAGNDLIRFGLNSTFGFGGIIDWAGELGLERHDADFGITLGRWGAPPGAFLVLPVLGPSTVRDTIGLPADLKFSADQFVSDVALRNSLAGLRLVNARAQLLAATSLLDDIVLDKYTFVRDAYLQRRQSLIYDGEPPEPEEDGFPLPEPRIGPTLLPEPPAPPASAPAPPPASAPAPAPAPAPGAPASAPTPGPPASAPAR
jgi:phospholipid-binding lipoprotein MlaA